MKTGHKWTEYHKFDHQEKICLLIKIFLIFEFRIEHRLIFKMKEFFSAGGIGNTKKMPDQEGVNKESAYCKFYT